MNGSELRAKRLFNADSGRSYIVAIDHGLSMGAKPGAEDAVAVGGDAIIMYFVFGVADGKTFVDNLTAIGRAAAEAHELGLPLIAEVVAWGSQAPDRRDPELLRFGCRIAAELGADLIKTEYTGSPESMRTVIESCPAPVMVLGGAKLDSPEALYDMTRDALSAGAVGVVYGRNIWQADDPAKVGAAVRSIVHGQG
jgi:DhnA family fructose-bisphosphate aldolase class Ia